MDDGHYGRCVGGLYHNRFTLARDPLVVRKCPPIPIGLSEAESLKPIQYEETRYRWQKIRLSSGAVFYEWVDETLPEDVAMGKGGNGMMSPPDWTIQRKGWKVKK